MFFKKAKSLQLKVCLTASWRFTHNFINEYFSEESPPKKRRIEAAQVIKLSQPEEKTESEPATSKEPDEIVPTESKEESKETATTSTTTVLAQPSILVASRNDLIKDIESHIEIIYECLDELNESGSSSMLNKTPSIEPMSISSENSSIDTENTVKDATETGDEKANDSLTAPDESKSDQSLEQFRIK